VTCSEAGLELCSVLVKALPIAIDSRVEEVLACVDTPWLGALSVGIAAEVLLDSCADELDSTWVDVSGTVLLDCWADELEELELWTVELVDPYRTAVLLGCWVDELDEPELWVLELVDPCMEAVLPCNEELDEVELWTIELDDSAIAPQVYKFMNQTPPQYSASLPLQWLLHPLDAGIPPPPAVFRTSPQKHCWVSSVAKYI
jgi:hypothetical protein